ncbi:hypothetical protein [Halopseudomonas bauzanensis]|uniref:hypothetical protein n=1 Tax=Halopseudomonas bauzanensis TaxID=653930 RepID=UPI00255507DD|nr:hypothetical protein [Halopseudomonas bauzanensis]
MIITPAGPFNGTTWEATLQLVLKSKFGADGYQHVPATPGDFGIEGFTKHTGLAFQCYCPDAPYERNVLKQKQQDKITRDLKKLKDNQASLQGILGATKIKDWYFITPAIAHNALLTHAQKKQDEVRAWALPHLDVNFTVLIHDIDFYIKEINQHRISAGVPISIGQDDQTIPRVNESTTSYDENLERKTELRMSDKGERAVAALLNKTKNAFLDHDSFFQTLYSTSPQTYFQIAKTLNGFEENVEEWSLTTSGHPDKLVEMIKDRLSDRLMGDKRLLIDGTLTDDIVRRTVARWLAVCQLDFYS